MGQGIPPYSYNQFRASDIEETSTTLKVFSYEVVWAEHRTHHLPDDVRMPFKPINKQEKINHPNILLLVIE